MKLNDVIDMVEVGMRIGLNNSETGCFFGGTVIRKLLIHDSETHEEYYHLEVELDDLVKEITEIEKYNVYALVDRKCRDLLKVRRKRLKERYFPADGYMDDEVSSVFWEMINAWDDNSEADREDLAKILFEKMDADDLKEIMDEVSENQKDLDEDDGFYNVYDEDDDLDDEEAF